MRIVLNQERGFKPNRYNYGGLLFERGVPKDVADDIGTYLLGRMTNDERPFFRRLFEPETETRRQPGGVRIIRDGDRDEEEDPAPELGEVREASAEGVTVEDVLRAKTKLQIATIYEQITGGQPDMSMTNAEMRAATISLIEGGARAVDHEDDEVVV